jgi:hypothetical protein
MTSANLSEGGAGGSLTRVTANFTPRAMAALEKVASVWAITLFPRAAVT